jgi:hypothetical protein
MSSSANVSTKQQRIAELAKQMPEATLWSLSRFIDVDWLKEAYRRTRKDGAAGVDGITADEYATRLDENLAALLGRAKSGSYRAPPVKRAHIPKGDGETRPIGIPTFEDKVLQRAVVMALEPVYEQEFFDCSYGFRPKRGVHGALASFWNQAMKMAGGWVIEVDGDDEEGTVGYQAQDRFASTLSRTSPHRGVVSRASTRSTSGAARITRAQATRALRVLRHHRELGSARSLSLRSEGHLVRVVVAALAAADELATLCTSARPLPAAERDRGALGPTASEPMT